MKRISTFLAVFLGGASLHAATLNENDRIQFANSLLARGLNEAAVSELENFLKDVPQSSKADEAHFRLGFGYRALQRLADADREYKTVFESYPQSAFRMEAGFERAMLANEQKDYPTAIADFKALLDAKPPANVAATALYISGEGHRAIHEPAAALVEYRQIRDLYPGTDMYPFALLRVGEILSSIKGQDVEALAAFDKLLATQTTERMLAEAAFLKGELLFRQKNYAASAETYGRLLGSYSNDFRAAEAELHASWSFYHAGQTSNALQLAERVIQAGGASAEWQYLQANCLRELGNVGGAGEAYAALLHDSPDDPLATPARYELAAMQFQQGRYPVVIDLLTPVVSAGHADDKTLWLLGESQASVTNAVEAVRCYELLLTNFPTCTHAADATFRLGFQYRQLGKLEDAAGWYEKAIVQSSDSGLAAQAVMAAASCRMELKQDAAAAALFAKLVESYPSDAMAGEARFQKAMCEVRLKQSDAALATLHALAAVSPAPARVFEAQYWIGVLERQAGKNAESEVALRAALQTQSTTERWVPNARLQLAGVLQANGKSDEAAAVYQLLLGTDAANQLTPELLSWLAAWSYEKKDYVQSAAAARQLTLTATDPPWIQTGASLLGQALLAANDLSGAEQAYEKAVGQNVQTVYAPESALRLAELKRTRGDLVSASNYFVRAAEWAKDDTGEGVRAHAYVGLARTAKQGEDWEQAAKYFMSVGLLYRDPEIVPECLYEAAAINQKLGHTNEVAQALKDLRSLYPDSDWAKKSATLGK